MYFTTHRRVKVIITVKRSLLNDKAWSVYTAEGPCTNIYIQQNTENKPENIDKTRKK